MTCRSTTSALFLEKALFEKYDTLLIAHHLVYSNAYPIAGDDQMCRYSDGVQDEQRSNFQLQRSEVFVR